MGVPIWQATVAIQGFGNVGGETAGQVGRKLRGLGRNHQVLCITHLPQVAAQGDNVADARLAVALDITRHHEGLTGHRL